MIMFSGAKVRLLDPHVSRHPQMQPKKIAARKLDENLLSACNRAEETRPSQLPNECTRIGFAKNPFSRMKFYPQDFVADRRIPLSAKIFDFGELGHRAK